MPMDRRLYPPDWKAIAHQVKQESGWSCEECGRQCRQPGERLDLFVKRVAYLPVEEVFEHPQRWTLTVAHLNHIPSDCSRSNLMALCAPCHCRYDLSQMGRKRYLKRERLGQMVLSIFPDQSCGCRN